VKAKKPDRTITAVLSLFLFRPLGKHRLMLMSDESFFRLSGPLEIWGVDMQW